MVQNDCFLKIMLFLSILLLILPIIPAEPKVNMNSLNENGERVSENLFHEKHLSKMISKVNESKVYDYVKTISSFGPRPTGSEALDNVCKYIFKTFRSLNLSVVNESWHTEDLSGKNIVSTIPGKTDKMMIVTAHADTVSVSPGADDDGSGIAANLMIAEIMNRYTFHNTVKFIIFTGEENGVLGSSEYAKKAYENNEEIIGVLSLDKIGYAQSVEDGSKIRHHANLQSDWMIDISETIALQFYNQIKLDVVRLPFDGSSDHRAFVKYGFSGSNLAEESLNPVYHTSEDTIEYINSSYLTKVTKLALGVASKIANLNVTLNKNDVDIRMNGSIHSSPSRLTITVKKERNFVDTANVSITIQMKHLFRDSFVLAVKDYYTTPCIWNFTKEIKNKWEFKIGPHVFTQGLFSLEVIIKGRNDDIGFVKDKTAVGVIIYPNLMFLFSK